MYVDTVTRTHGRSDRREGSQTDRWTGERMDTRVDKRLGEWMVWRTDGRTEDGQMSHACLLASLLEIGKNSDQQLSTDLWPASGANVVYSSISAEKSYIPRMCRASLEARGARQGWGSKRSGPMQKSCAFVFVFVHTDSISISGKGLARSFPMAAMQNTHACPSCM